eukprot:5244636-Pyramimonas_sp.AAC.1
MAPKNVGIEIARPIHGVLRARLSRPSGSHAVDAHQLMHENPLISKKLTRAGPHAAQRIHDAASCAFS